jgi:hypothetical protein
MINKHVAVGGMRIDHGNEITRIYLDNTLSNTNPTSRDVGPNSARRVEKAAWPKIFNPDNMVGSSRGLS